MNARVVDWIWIARPCRTLVGQFAWLTRRWRVTWNLPAWRRFVRRAVQLSRVHHVEGHHPILTGLS